jgi:CheY-like chemotaxis protein
MNAERIRLKQAKEQKVPWKKWGPCLSERQWGTVREATAKTETLGTISPRRRRRYCPETWRKPELGRGGLRVPSLAESYLKASVFLQWVWAYATARRVRRCSLITAMAEQGSSNRPVMETTVSMKISRGLVMPTYLPKRSCSGHPQTRSLRCRMELPSISWLTNATGGNRPRMSGATTILVIDDDPRMLSPMTEVLGGAGYEVLQATTGKECLDAARSYHPDIVLLDVMLPDMTGVEECRQLKNEPELQGTFVILVPGAWVSSDYQAAGLDIGADGYIVKGVTNREFLARIQALVRIKRAEDALREREDEQNKLISEPEKALAEIRTLKGLIPICASCKLRSCSRSEWILRAPDFQ